MASHEFRYENIQASAESRLHLGNQTTTNNHYYSPSPAPAEHLPRPPISNTVQIDFLRACHQGQRRRVEHLLSKGADVEGVDSQNCTPLHYAALGGSLQTVEFLVAQGVDLNAMSTWYGSPLCLAALKGRVAVVEALLAEGALVNFSCRFLGSAAHAACVGGDVATVQALSARGADFKAQRTTCIEAWEDLLALEEDSLLELRDWPLDKCLRIHHGSPGALAVQFDLLRIVDYCLNELACLSVHESLSLSQEWTKESLLFPQTVPLSHWVKDSLIMNVSSKADDRMMRVLLPHDSTFIAQPGPSEFFTIGTVFSALRPKTASGADSNAPLATSISGNNEAITSEVRRFVVIYERDDAVSCSCVPIIALDEAPLSESEHAIVYTGSEIPSSAQGNALVVWDHQAMLKPIMIDPNTPSDVLRPMSRLNFGDISIVQHSARVTLFGKVHLSAVADVIHHFSGVWARTIKRIQEALNPKSADCDQVTSPSFGGQPAILPRRPTLQISDESDSGSTSDTSFSALGSGHYRQSTPFGTIRSDESLYQFLSVREFALSTYHISRIKGFSKRYRSSIVKDGRSDTLPRNSSTGCHDWATRTSVESNAPDALSDVNHSLFRAMKELVVLHCDSKGYSTGQQKLDGANSTVSVEAILAVIDSAVIDSSSSNGRTSSTSRYAVPAVPHRLVRELHRACRGLEEYDTLFSMLPAGVKCASVFYESMEWIVASSLRNLYKATTLLNFMTKLNASMTGFVKNLDLYPRRWIRRIAMELYTRIFELLAKVVKCFDRDSLLLSRQQRAYADCEAALQDICDWLETINSTALRDVVLELRDAREEDRILPEELNIQARFREDMRNMAENFYELQKNRDLQLAVQQDQVKLLSSEAHQESFADLVLRKFEQHFKDLALSQTSALAKMSGSVSRDAASPAASDDRIE